MVLLPWFVIGDAVDDLVSAEPERKCGERGGGHIEDGRLAGNIGGDIEIVVAVGEVGFGADFVKFAAVNAEVGIAVAAIATSSGGGGILSKSFVTALITIDDSVVWLGVEENGFRLEVVGSGVDDGALRLGILDIIREDGDMNRQTVEEMVGKIGGSGRNDDVVCSALPSSEKLLIESGSGLRIDDKTRVFVLVLENALNVMSSDIATGVTGDGDNFEVASGIVVISR